MAPRAKTAAPKATATAAKNTKAAPAPKVASKAAASKAAASKAAPKAAPKKAATNGASNKRKVEELPDHMDIDEPETTRPIKKVKAAAEAPVKKAKAPVKAAVTKPESKRPKYTIGKKINEAPAETLNVFVFGEGTSGELGLGSKRVDNKKPIDVKRPRLNHNLSPPKEEVVQLSCGGMHAIALTRDNKILTWGVNDQGALGRDTNWDGGLIDMDKAEGSDSEDDEDDTGINPRESIPGRVDDEYFAEGTKFVQVVASDSSSFILTEDGRVYGWGTFRSSDGILGFTEKVKIQQTPMLIAGLKNIKALAAGSNHILALEHSGNVVAWGCGQQNQLGRRIIERNKMSSLIPQGIRLPRGKVAKIACGSYHSFAIDKEGAVWGWGLNNFGEIGVETDAGQENAVILHPVKIPNLDSFKVEDIAGGEHHSVACTTEGQLLTWGRVDGSQVGIDPKSMTEHNAIFDDRNNPRILHVPTIVPDVSGICSVSAGTDNSFAVTKDGKVYSWGFSSNYQTGQGTIDDVEIPTVIDNTAIRGAHVVSSGAGGQFSILLAETGTKAETNGVNGHA